MWLSRLSYEFKGKLNNSSIKDWIDCDDQKIHAV